MSTDFIGEVRAMSTYRVTFNGLAWGDTNVIARQIADILREMRPTEIRVTADDPHGSIVAYCLVPSDVMPEALDRRADALRAAWKAPGERVASAGGIHITVNGNLSGIDEDALADRMARLLEVTASGVSQ